MPILLYGIAEADVHLDRLIGVHDARVDSTEESRLRCFHSSVDNIAHSGQDALRDDALRFHSVIRGIFHHAAVVPFRFPTMLQSETEVRDHLRSRQETYLQILRKLRGLAQMEVRIRAGTASGSARSGTQYMRARQAESRNLTTHADAARLAASDLLHDWRVHAEAGGLRCYALVRRERVNDFEQRMRSLSPIHDAIMIVSGPWPATEFVDAINS